LNQLNKLSRQDIKTKYLNKPILIVDGDDIENWYIVSDIDTTIPLHLLAPEESDLHDKDESNINGIEVVDVDGKGYLLWIYFNQIDGWKALGYE